MEGLELLVSHLQATVSLQLDGSTGTAQATSSATPSPGNTHSHDTETPPTPRSLVCAVTLSTQPEPAVPFSMQLFLQEDLHSLFYDQTMSPTSTDACSVSRDTTDPIG